MKFIVMNSGGQYVMMHLVPLKQTLFVDNLDIVKLWIMIISNCKLVIRSYMYIWLDQLSCQLTFMLIMAVKYTLLLERTLFCLAMINVLSRDFCFGGATCNIPTVLYFTYIAHLQVLYFLYSTCIFK